MFKRLIHYLTSTSLDRHRRETHWRVAEYEEKAARARARIEAQQERYQAELQALWRQREAEQKEFAAHLDAHAERTTDYAEMLASLQNHMLGCLEDWMAKSLAETRLALQWERIERARSEIDLLQELQDNMRLLAHQPERDEWLALVEIRPPRVQTPAIREHLRQFNEEVERQDQHDFQRELRRLKSQLRTLYVNLRKLRREHAETRKDETIPAQQRFREGRGTLLSQFHQCRAAWTALQDELEAGYRQRPAESELAQEWLRGTEHGGNYRELQQILLYARQESDEINASQDRLDAEMKAIKAHINAAHANQAYSDLDELKERRNVTFVRRKAVGEKGFRVRQAMKEIRHRRKAIEEFRSMLDKLHPAETVRNVFDRVGKDDPELYWNAIGIHTKALPRPMEQLA